jgi:hypothetical protein
MRVSSPFSGGCDVVRAEHIEDTVHEEDVLAQDMTKLRGDWRCVIKAPGLEAGPDAGRSFEEGAVVRANLPDDLRGD